ncbi:MAG: trans-aconitate 2-methyltransferase [Halobacteriaceae archaeon]
MAPDEWSAEYFDEQYADPDPWDFASADYERQKYRRQIRVLRDHGPDVDAILELGCAEGVHSEMLLDAFPGADLVGVDIAPAAVRRARERVGTERTRFVCADVADAVADLEGPFDAVVWSETIYYQGDSMGVPALYDLICDVDDLLADDGVLCLANIVDQQDAPETPLTRAPVIEAYRALLSGRFCPVHEAEYTESKEDREHTYRVWGFRPERS